MTPEDPADEFILTDELKQELDRRVAEEDADDAPGEEWEVVKARLLRGEF